MVVVVVDRERRQKVCADCGEEIDGFFLALPALGLFLHPRCGCHVGRLLQEEAEEAFELSVQGAFGQRVRS